MISRRTRRNDTPLAILAIAGILSFFFVFHMLIAPSGHSDDCRGIACQSKAAAAPTTAVSAQGDEVSFQATTQAPALTAASAAVVDDCGNLIFAKDAHRRLPPASITKIVTALVAVETTDPDDIVDVNVDNFYAGDSTVMGLQTGMRLSLRDLLYGLLLPSGNDAAIAIARYVAGDVPSFVNRMNAKVRDLGLQDTHFTDPHGLDAAGHYSSAYDMAMLGRYAMKNPLLAEIVKTKQYQPNWDGPELWNGNLLLWLYPDSDGVKIGWTEKAGQTIVATAQRNGQRVFVALFNSQDRYSDAIRLFDWAFENLADNPSDNCGATSAQAGQ